MVLLGLFGVFLGLGVEMLALGLWGEGDKESGVHVCESKLQEKS